MPAQRNEQKRPTHGTGAARREALRRKRVRQARVHKARTPAAITVVVLVVGVLFVALALRPSSSKHGPPAGAASSFGTSTKATGSQTIDGIPCEAGERLTYHVHAHLAIFVNGKQETVPQSMGINPDKPCFYWLHTHTPDGVIHIEAPQQASFTLGQLFDVWGQPLSASQVASAGGAVTAFVDGKPFTGDPRSIGLARHTEVQLDVGSAQPGAQPFSFSAGE